MYLLLLQTHINAMEVDTPVGSSPGGNEAITMLARRGQGGAGGCQRSHCSYSFLRKGKEKTALWGFFFFTLRQTNRPRSGFENSITEQDLDGRWCVCLR